MGKLEGKIAIITGASGGLGKQIAKRFVMEGAKIAICARTESKLMITKAECEELGGEVLAMPVDLCCYDQMEKFVNAVVDKYGTIDVLVNNGVTTQSPVPFLDQTIETLDQVMKSGLYATWHMMKLCFPYMKDKEDASIINFGSASSRFGAEGFAAYVATKGAINSLSRLAAREWGKYHIRVNIASPSAVTDNVMEGVKMLPPEQQEYVKATLSTNPLHRPGDPFEDITPGVVFLASSDSRWITGDNLLLEGGGDIHS